MTGDEVAFEFTPSAAGTAEATLEYLWVPFTTELDLFVLDGSGGCDPAACIATDLGIGPDEVSWAVTPGATYYLVVDGWSDSTAIFTLDLSVQ